MLYNRSITLDIASKPAQCLLSYYFTTTYIVHKLTFTHASTQCFCSLLHTHTQVHIIYKYAHTHTLLILDATSRQAYKTHSRLSYTATHMHKLVHIMSYNVMHACTIIHTTTLALTKLGVPDIGHNILTCC